jgi:hypothetical protein
MQKTPRNEPPETRRSRRVVRVRLDYAENT